VSAFLVLVPAGTGLVMIISGLRRWTRTRRLTDTGEQALATVVDNQIKSHRRGTTTFHPVVTFTTRSGHEVRTVLTGQSSNRSHPPGTQQPVAFDPGHPDRPVPATGQIPGTAGTLIVGSVFLLFSGVALFLVGITFLSPDGILTDLP
jgi:hypothetical protein